MYGDHTEGIDDVYDISNKRRLGLTEYQAVCEMYFGVKHVIDAELNMQDCYKSSKHLT